jgi:hypothetical protein
MLSVQCMPKTCDKPVVSARNIFMTTASRKCTDHKRKRRSQPLRAVSNGIYLRYLPPLSLHTAVLASFYHGTAEDHILDATRCPPVCPACIAFLNDMLMDHLPHIPELLVMASPSTNLQGASGLSPSSTPGYAPPHCALCGMIAMNLGPSLALLQLGVSFLGRAEGAGDALRSSPHPNSHHLLLSLDCTNASNSMSRQATFPVAQQHTPHPHPHAPTFTLFGHTAGHPEITFMVRHTTQPWSTPPAA